MTAKQDLISFKRQQHQIAADLAKAPFAVALMRQMIYDRRDGTTFAYGSHPNAKEHRKNFTSFDARETVEMLNARFGTVLAPFDEATCLDD